MAPQSHRRQQHLSREIVVDAAVRLVDQEGIGALTMRGLGRELDVEAMALYHYVPHRDALIDLVIDRVVDQLYADPEVLLRPEESWQDYLRRVAAGVRRVALAHPRLFPVLATRAPAAPWVRPPLRSLRWVEAFLNGVQAHGFSDEDALYAYRAFTSFLVGHLLLDVSAVGADHVPGVAGVSAAVVDLSEFPTLVRLAPQLAADHSAEEFDDSLDNLLRRLARRLEPVGPT